MLSLAEVTYTRPLSDPVTVFAALMLVVLIVPLIMQRMRAPGLVGLMLIGVVLGPNGLNVLEREGAIEVLGTAGLLYIVFVAGLELDFHQFLRFRTHSLIFGGLAFLIPATMAVCVGLFVLGYEVSAAILLASVLGPHTPVSYPIVSRLGLAKHPAVTTVIGGTIVAETAALLVLAVVASTQEGETGPLFWFQLIAKMAVYIVVGWWGLPRLGRWFFRVVPADGGAHFVFLMAALYVTASLSHLAGVEPIIGAFLAGLALNRLVPEQGVLMTRVQFAGDWLFVPVFMVSVGMLVDPRVLIGDSRTWVVAGCMVGTVIVGKVAAAWIAGAILKFSPLERWLAYGLSTSQAAAALAAVFVGYELELFDEAVLNGAVITIVTTCTIGPAATQRFGRSLARQAESETPPAEGGPRRVLVPLRNPEAAPQMMDLAFMMREEDSPEPVYPLTVVADGADSSSQVASGERMLGSAVAHATAAEVPVSPTLRVDQNPVEGIIRAVKELRISTVVMGWSGPGMATHLVFGTVLDQLLSRTSEQFVVCRLSKPMNTFERIVMVIPPFAMREVGFTEAVRSIKTLSQRTGMSVTVSAVGRELDKLREAIDKIKPEAKIEYSEVGSIEDWLEASGPSLEQSDLFVLLAARRTQLSWRPSIDRLPQRILGHGTGASMLVVYPSERRPQATRAAKDPLAGSTLLSAERVHARVGGGTPSDLIAGSIKLLKDLDASDRAMIGRELTRVAEEAPIELAPGIVLLHIHTPAVRTAFAVVVSTAASVRFARVKRESEAVFMLLTPRSASSGTHLKNLASIAQLLHDPEVCERIRAAESDEELAEALALGESES